MTEQDERLARAWLALVPWRVGMVDARGEVITGREINIDPVRIPDLNSPANWGHWLAWAARSASGDMRLECVSRKRWHALWRGECELSWVATAGWHSPAGALMEIAARVHDDQPPAVLDWWKHEQEATDGDA